MGRGRGNFLEIEGRGDCRPPLSQNPSPSSSKTFNWWGGRTKGVRSDASPKEQVPAGRLEQRFSPCPLIILQCESSEVGPPKSSDCRVKLGCLGKYVPFSRVRRSRECCEQGFDKHKSLWKWRDGLRADGFGEGEAWGRSPPFFRKVSPPPQCFSSVYSSRPYLLIFRYSVGRLTPRAKAV